MSNLRFQPGALIARKYEVVRLVGAGGMGEVYLCRDRLMHREVAVKVLPLRRSGEAGFRERMEREAYAGSRANHPNLVKVLDLCVSDDNELILVMEFLEGLRTLRDMIHRAAPFRPEVAVPWLVMMTHGICALHLFRILHRDLKPENVGIIPTGELKIIDYGLARVRNEALRTTVNDGRTLMTPHYAAPEQLTGDRPVTERADIYAVGMIGIELLTNRHAFQVHTEEFPTEVQVRYRKTNAAPLKVSDFAKVPDALADVLQACLALEPSERPTGEQLLHVLEKVAIDLGCANRASTRESPVPSAARPGARALPAAPAPASAIEVTTTAPQPPAHAPDASSHASAPPAVAALSAMRGRPATPHAGDRGEFGTMRMQPVSQGAHNGEPTPTARLEMPATDGPAAANDAAWRSASARPSDGGTAGHSQRPVFTSTGAVSTAANPPTPRQRAAAVALGIALALVACVPVAILVQRWRASEAAAAVVTEQNAASAAAAVPAPTSPDPTPLVAPSAAAAATAPESGGTGAESGVPTPAPEAARVRPYPDAGAPAPSAAVPKSAPVGTAKAPAPAGAPVAAPSALPDPSAAPKPANPNVRPF